MHWKKVKGKHPYSAFLLAWLKRDLGEKILGDECEMLCLVWWLAG